MLRFETLVVTVQGLHVRDTVDHVADELAGHGGPLASRPSIQERQVGPAPFADQLHHQAAYVRPALGEQRDADVDLISQSVHPVLKTHGNV